MRYLTRSLSILSHAAGRTNSMANVFSAEDETVAHAVTLLKHGSVISLPTDTIYGIAADAKCDTAVQQLYKIKGRDFNKPVAICVGNVEDVHKWGETINLPPGLLERLLPGPVTVLLKRSNTISLSLNPGVEKVGIRVPDSNFIREVASSLGSAIALTSANISNELSTVKVEEFSHLWPLLGGVFDAGHLGESRAGSTIIDLTVAGKYSVERSGSALKGTIEIIENFGLKLLEKE